MGRIVLAVIVLFQTCAALAAPGDLEQIFKGVSTIAAPGSTGTVAAFGPEAFVVADGGGSGRLRQPVIAAAHLGKGRMVIFGHDGYFDPANWSAGETPALMVNLVNWAAENAVAKPVGIQRNAALLEALKAKKINAAALEQNGWLDQLPRFSAVILAGSPRNDAEVAALKRYVESGGGVLMAHTGWGWMQLNPGKTLKNDLPASKLAGAAGLAWTGGFASRDRGTGGFRITNPPPAALHAGTALDILLASPASNPADLAQAGATIMEVTRVLPDDSPLQQRLRKLQKDNAAAALPRPDQPLRSRDALPRLLLALQLQDLQDQPTDQVRAHPAAAFFPGAVPADAPRISKAISIDTRIPRWHSTGLYAPPGEIITVALPPDAVGQRLRIRIGAHTDHTYHLDAWHRAPEISRDWPLDKPATKVANAFGGLIYVEVPDRATPARFDLAISGGVAAPYFVLGKTSSAEWQTLRNAPAPWAELETDKLILTLKSDAIRQLDDPAPVLEHWRKVMDADATLAGWPLERKSPERIVNDADISAGYMHSGYPIMTGLDVTNNMVDLAALKTLNRGWGFYHELGHNHQNGDWTFDGTTEVTVNLFTMYTLEKVCGLSPDQATSRALRQPAARIKTYLAKPDFNQWKSDPFLALAMYAQLRNAFGWETYEKVFAEYRALPREQRPRSDDEKRDQWLVRFSKATGKNLGPFFQSWGIPTSEKARAAIADLPGWMPKEQ